MSGPNDLMRLCNRLANAKLWAHMPALVAEANRIMNDFGGPNWREVDARREIGYEAWPICPDCHKEIPQHSNMKHYHNPKGEQEHGDCCKLRMGMEAMADEVQPKQIEAPRGGFF